MPNSVKKQLDSLFDPKSITFIGASNDIAKWGGWTVQRTLAAGYRGAIYPVNAREQTIQGLRAYPTVLDIPDDIDLAVIIVPAPATVDVLEQCVQKRVKAAICITAGFAETGEKGRLLQEDLVRVARKGRIRLVGPNCMGIWSASSRLCMTFDAAPKSGPIAFISQSGTFGGFLLAAAVDRGYGFSRFVSAGNQADLGPADYLEYLAEDPETKVIVFYMEGLTDGRRFMEVAREVVKRKPIVVYKAGRTGAGKKAALSHTGSLSGEDRVFQAMCEQIGILRSQEAVHIFDMAEALARQPLPRGKRVAIVSSGGGFCVTMADYCGVLGLTIPTFDQEAQERIKAILLPHAPTPANPVDTAGDGRATTVPSAAAMASQLDYVDGVLCTLPHMMGDQNDSATERIFMQIAETLTKIPRELGKPLVVVRSAGYGENRIIAGLLGEAGIPVYDTPEDGARAIHALMQYGEIRRRAETSSDELGYFAPSRANGVAKSVAEAIVKNALQEGRASLGTDEAMELLAAYGIGATREMLVRTDDQLAEALRSIPLPVALKIDSPDIPHKTEAGLVKLSCQTEQEAEDAFADLMEQARRQCPKARVHGVLVQEMVSDCVECIVGVRRDDQFGPTIMFGLGGIFVEVFEDTALRIAPLRASDADAMIRAIKGYKILAGARGRAPADIEAIKHVLRRLSELAMDLEPYIAEIDVNPLMVGAEGRGAKAVDALIVLRSEVKYS